MLIKKIMHRLPVVAYYEGSFFFSLNMEESLERANILIFFFYFQKGFIPPLPRNL